MRNLFFILLLISSIARAQAPLSSVESTNLRIMVQEQADKTQTMTADFVQIKHLDFLSNDIESSGNLAFKKPNMVKWEYTHPSNHSFVFMDQKLFVNEDGKKSEVNLSSNKRFGQLEELIVNSITGDMFQEKDFEISYFRNEDGFEAVFVPRDNRLKKYIGQFHVFFQEDYYVRQLKMVESSGDYTVIRLNNRKVNGSISNQVFAH